ncbi:acyltransferase domain-containing protein [Pelomonas sp. KK5]|uniref:acyltransferase domain-containing protein n=1 Tax=Pelomonas sp. KK5 TaxID=1855730 RepID=UPI00097BCB38|nr:acyltransferase domain-containing protein [Pelomonas sp. KK5]
MPASFALMFSGQGSQHPQMLRWLPGGDWRAVLADPERAARNAFAQPLLTRTGLAAWQDLAPRLPPPAAMAGYSVGELAAFAAAGVFDADAAIELAGLRAAAMDACPPGGLLAVSGAAQLAWPGLEIAIRNAPELHILGGPDAALQKAEAAFTARGLRCTRLKVQVASHTSLMRWAARAFAAELAMRPLQPPRHRLLDSRGDTIRSPISAAATLAAQIDHAVHWDDTLDALQARQPACALEIGPGSALATMWNQRFPGTPARSADEFESAEAVAAWVLARL